MELRAPSGRNARRAFASTGSAAIPPALRHAKRVRQRKKEAESAVPVETSNTTPTPITNVQVARVPGRAFVNTTTALPVRRRPSVCRTIAWTAFAATTSVAERVKHVRRQRKAADTKVCADSFPQIPIRTMSAVPRVTEWARAIRLPAARRAYRPRIA